MRRLGPIFWLAGLVCCEPPSDPPRLPPPVAPSTDGVARLAGDDVASPLAGRLLEAYGARHPAERLSLEPALDGGGALRALADGLLAGAILAVPADAEPPEGGWRFARTEVVVAVGRGTGLRRPLSPATLAAALHGLQPPGAVGDVRVHLRAAPDPLQAAIERRSPVFARAVAGAYHTQRWPVHASGASLRAALRGTPNALAVADSGSLRLHGLPVWAVAIEGGPVHVDFWIVPGREATSLSPFLTWATGPDGQATVAELGYGSVR